MLQDRIAVRESDYLKIGYDDAPRFLSYWNQIQEIVQRVEISQPILEIGPGNRFMTDYLIKRGYKVKTLDIDAKHAPDYVGTVLHVPVADQAFTAVVCFQVLEHIPFESFKVALLELARISQKYVLVSVPDVRYFFEIQMSFFSSSKKYQKIISFPRVSHRNMPITKPGGHLWEIGRKKYDFARVVNAIPDTLNLIKHYRVQGNPIHHMFVFEKSF